MRAAQFTPNWWFPRSRLVAGFGPETVARHSAQSCKRAVKPAWQPQERGKEFLPKAEASSRGRGAQPRKIMLKMCRPSAVVTSPMPIRKKSSASRFARCVGLFISEITARCAASLEA